MQISDTEQMQFDLYLPWYGPGIKNQMTTGNTKKMWPKCSKETLEKLNANKCVRENKLKQMHERMRQLSINWRPGRAKKMGKMELEAKHRAAQTLINTRPNALGQRT